MKYNPFKPGSVVHPGMFSGRRDEINAIEKCLFQTKKGNPQNFLIQGERGIGKSSLVLYAKYLAMGDLKNNYNFVVIKVDLEPNYKFSDIIEKLIAEADSELSSNNKFESIKSSAKELLSQINSSYISFQKSEIPNNMLISSTAQVLKKISHLQNIDGVLILIDEADKPSSEAHLGSFFKLLTERLVTIGCNNVCVGVSGLPETIDKLRKSHESSLRIFQILNLETLNRDESRNVIDIGIKDANDKNDFKTAIKEEAKDLIAELSEGYPYFLQQFSYNSFEVDTDKVIDEDDVQKGIYDERKGALKELREKLFNTLFYNKIESEDYRRVLQYMAKKEKQWITRADIVKNSQLKSYTINNALKALKERYIIFDNPSKKGEYRLPSKSFAIWINIFTEHQEQNGN